MDSATTWPCQGRLSDGSPCGEPLDAESEFCTNCGSKAVRPTEEKICPNCHKPLPKRKAAFCGKCGFKLRPSSTDPAAAIMSRAEAANVSVPETSPVPASVCSATPGSLDSSITVLEEEEENGYTIVRPTPVHPTRPVPGLQMSSTESLREPQHPSLDPRLTQSPTFQLNQTYSHGPQGPHYAPGHYPSITPGQPPSEGPSFTPVHVPSQGPSFTPGQPPSKGQPFSTGQAPSQGPPFAPGQSPPQGPPFAPGQSPPQGPPFAPGQGPPQGPPFAPGQSPPQGPPFAPGQGPPQGPPFASGQAPQGPPFAPGPQYPPGQPHPYGHMFPGQHYPNMPFPFQGTPAEYQHMAQYYAQFFPGYQYYGYGAPGFPPFSYQPPSMPSAPGSHVSPGQQSLPSKEHQQQQEEDQESLKSWQFVDPDWYNRRHHRSSPGHLQSPFQSLSFASQESSPNSSLHSRGHGAQPESSTQVVPPTEEGPAKASAPDRDDNDDDGVSQDDGRKNVKDGSHGEGKNKGRTEDEKGIEKQDEEAEDDEDSDDDSDDESDEDEEVVADQTGLQVKTELADTEAVSVRSTGQSDRDRPQSGHLRQYQYVHERAQQQVPMHQEQPRSDPSQPRLQHTLVPQELKDQAKIQQQALHEQDLQEHLALSKNKDHPQVQQQQQQKEYDSNNGSQDDDAIKNICQKFSATMNTKPEVGDSKVSDASQRDQGLTEDDATRDFHRAEEDMEVSEDEEYKSLEKNDPAILQLKRYNSGPYSLMDDLAKKSEHRREPESLEMDQNYYSNDDGNDMTKSQEGTKRDSGKKYSGSQVSSEEGKIKHPLDGQKDEERKLAVVTDWKTPKEENRFQGRQLSREDSIENKFSVEEAARKAPLPDEDSESSEGRIETGGKPAPGRKTGKGAPKTSDEVAPKDEDRDSKITPKPSLSEDQNKGTEVPYNKRDKEPDDYVQGKGRKGGKGNKKQQSQHGMATRQQTRQKPGFIIRFHVIVSPDFNYHKKESRIYIWFASPFMEQVEMNFVRRFSDDSVLMTCDVEVEKHLINRLEHRRYRYGLERHANMKWEHIEDNANGHRILSIDPSNQNLEGIVHQYDGYMLKDAKSWQWKKKLDKWRGANITHEKELVTKALKVMQPSWDNLVANEFLAHIKRLSICLKSWSLLSDKREVKDTCFQEFLLSLAREKMMVFKEATKGKRLDDTLASVMCILLMCETFDIELKRDDVSILLDAILPQGNCQDVDDLYRKHFSPEMNDLGSYLERFFRASVEKYPSEYKLLNCIPLLHFLREDSQPFTVPNVCQSNLHEDPSWWGIFRITNAVDKMKQSLKNKEIGKMELYLEEVKHLFHVDWLFARTILATSSPKHIAVLADCKEVPLDGFLAMVSYHIKMKNVKFFEFKDLLASLRRRISSEEPALSGSKQDMMKDTHLVISWSMASGIGMDVLSHFVAFSLSDEFSHRNVIDIVQILEMVLRTYNKLRKSFKELHAKEAAKPANEHLENDFINMVTHWLEVWLHYLDGERMFSLPVKRLYELEVWSGLLNVNFIGEGKFEIWHGTIMHELKTRTKQMSEDDIVSIFIYSVKAKEHHPALVDHFTQCAFQAAEHGMQLFNHGYTFEVVTLLAHVLLKSWPKVDEVNFVSDEASVVEHVLKTPSFNKYLDLYQNSKEGLRQQSRRLLEDTRDILSKLLQDLETGDITLHKLSHVVQNAEALTSCIASAKLFTNETLNEEVLLQLIEQRRAEMEGFNVHLNQVRVLLLFCERIQYVDSKTLNERLGHDIWLSTLNETANARQNHQDNTYGFFDLPVEYQEILDKMQTFNKCIIFQKIFKTIGQELTWRKGRRNEHGTLTLKDVARQVWPSALKTWNRLSTKMIDGTITLAEIDKYFCTVDDIRLREEIQTMLPACIAAERVEQLGRYKQIRRYQQAAQEMLNVQEDLNLAGDFSLMEKIVNASEDKSLELSTMTADVLEAGQALAAMGREQTYVIQVFRQSAPFLEWIRVNVPRLEELKVLVDLGLIAAHGQGDLEMTKVTCLNDAVHGFAPLIYDLDENAGFEEFYQKCQAIWPVLVNDPALPTKLADVTKELEWLKRLKDTQGEVEVNALKQVDAINNHGIYIVNGRKSTSVKTLEDMISVEIPPKERGPGQTNKVYTYSDLKELQGKLMLVAGKAEKGKEDVDGFVEIFDGLCSLAITYIRICTAGSILFQDWSAKFYCDQSKPVNAFIDFGLSKSKLPGRSEDADVAHQITQIRDFMDNCLAEWRSYVSTKRREYQELNHYTTEQLVTLRSELAKLTNQQENPSPRVLALLHDVFPNCTLQDLQGAVKSAIKVIKDKEIRHRKQDKEAGGEDEDEDDDEDPVIAQLLKEGFNRQTIQHVIDVYGMDDFDEMEWRCQERKEMEDEMNVEEETEPENFIVLQSDVSLTHMADEYLTQLSKQKSKLKDKLKGLWEKFLGSATMSVADYLSVEHLGIILNELSNRQPLHRSLPTYLKKGQPNLIVCPQSDVLLTVMSTYMCDLDTELPMPTREEVLLCTEDTGAEEVELLLWRAVQDQLGRIYMLVNIGQLRYDVAVEVEKAIERRTQGESEYRLVLVCNAERQDRSLLVAALDHHRVHNPILQPLDSIKNYIHLNLAGAQENMFVDPENRSVRVVRSDRAGNGKSLWKDRKLEELAKLLGMPARDISVSLPLHGRSASILDLLEALLPHTRPVEDNIPRLFHIDIPHEMNKGVDHLLFNLVVLGSLVDQVGYIWRRSNQDLYIIEIMPLRNWEIGNKETEQIGHQVVHPILDLLPTVTCRSPMESLNIMNKKRNEEDLEPKTIVWSVHDQLMDQQQFTSAPFQRVYQYLHRFRNNQDLRGINPAIPLDDDFDCLKTLMAFCGLESPSWAELEYFIRFLNKQLQSCEQSIYCSRENEDAFPKFLLFVVRFMIQMSKDFSTRSLKMAEETRAEPDGDDPEDQVNLDELSQFQLKRLWETSPHPYIFFNPDLVTMTFLGFKVQLPAYDIVDPQTNEIIEEKIMEKLLYDGLRRNGVDLTEDFNELPRMRQIEKLCMVMGNDRPHDPDVNYVLTSDNVKKMLAIQMRFRCKIPVIVMGETGCGKTHLIKFMCRLQIPANSIVKNMSLMKVHGGTTELDIVRKIEVTEQLAIENRKIFPNMLTVLFMDEVNTTEALGLVKEILCDHSVKGRKLDPDSGLRLIAACNPYRKHSEEAITMLEKAGLGYHVHAEETTDTLGRIPMRRLVYRVQPLPQSMLPLVWDFGQLQQHAEKLYITQIVRKKLESGVITPDALPENSEMVITNILVEAQRFMRQQEDECSFVSLRDVERTMDVLEWFYQQRNLLYKLMDEHALRQEAGRRRRRRTAGNEESEEEESEDDESVAEDDPDTVFDPLVRSLILALGVCYYACLQAKRRDFLEHVYYFFTGQFELPRETTTMEDEIICCQDVMLENVKLGENIARNQALKENVFMMVVCINLRIPLFLVGKPGSSKSLAKTIVVDNMKGIHSPSALFKSFKQVYMISYQCSPLSTSDGIVGIFQQCAQLQKDKDLDKYAAVVVLDEVGLAEDSPRMPLKALHSLLEDGSHREEEAEPYKKVGFIGISNWSLDPAKMNRGILVQRGSPDVQELKATAIDICSSDETIAEYIEPLMRPLAQGYADLYDQAITDLREFFGLRDFYSLVKMVYSMAERKRGLPSWKQLEHAILRNFGGLEILKPVQVFRRYLDDVNMDMRPQPDDPDNSPRGLFTASLEGNGMKWESRYLLLLTENYAALPILRQSNEEMKDAIIIFGSSFPKDQEYTVVCRNINRIKICMETGQTVILLNLENLYESIYDLLNMYFSYFGKERHVDLGLGTHRVKSRVKEGFKIIVVAEKENVYKKFPIPLINRLEKHYVAMSTILTEQQKDIVERLEQWANKFAQPMMQSAISSFGPRQALSDLFVGYNPDTLASIVSHVCLEAPLYGEDEEQEEEWDNDVLRNAQMALLECATPEAVVRTSHIVAETGESVLDVYWRFQQHESLLEYLQVHLTGEGVPNQFIQVTTHSNLLSNKNMIDIGTRMQSMGLILRNTSLQAFNTEQQFSHLMGHYFTTESSKGQVLIIQCESGDQNADLIACARYIIHDEYTQAQKNVEKLPCTQRHVLLVIKLPRIRGGCFSGFEGGIWQSLHLDDLREEKHSMPPVQMLIQHTVSSLIGSALNKQAQDGEDEDNQEIRPSCNLDLDHLIKLCIHGAAGMVRNECDLRGSATLIRDMLDLFASEEGIKVIDVIKQRIYLLLKNREETIMTKDMALRWLTKDVASVKAINQAGTFRQSIWLYLESKVTPILAGLMAYMNTNNNLWLITKPNQVHWIRQMWLEMLEDPTLTQLEYDDLRSKSNKTELTEMVVKMMGAHGTKMDGCLPFSWIIKEQVSKLINQHIQRDYHFTGVKLIKEVGRLLKQSPLWRILAIMFRDAGRDMIQAYYLDDFVKMVHHPKSKLPGAEYELVKQALEATIVHLHLTQDAEGTAAEEGDFRDPENIIPMIHIAELAIHTRLQIFSQVLVYHPDTIKDLITFTQTEKEHPLSTTSEMVLDILTVHLVVKTVQPDKNLLRNQKQSREWQDQVEKLAPLVNDVLARSVRDVGESGLGSYGYLCQNALGDIQSNWQRVHTVKLFADIVCPRGSDQEKNITKMCPKLWEKLDDLDFKTERTMINVKDYLKHVIKMVCRQIARAVRECGQCNEPLLRTVLLSCGDAVCPDCLQQLQIAEDFTCPECRQPYEQDNQVAQSEERETIERVDKLRHLCNTFFVEIVTRMCFDGGEPPDDALVRMLMEYVTGRRPQNANNEQPIRTKQINLFNDNLDPNPVIRSVLLQLLLRSSIESVRGLVSEFYDMAQEIASGESQLELGIIYTQCLEDHYFNNVNSEVDKTNQAGMAIELLRESRAVQEEEHEQEDNDTVRWLEWIAKVRFGLGFVADLMHTIFIDGSAVVHPASAMELFEEAQQVCLREDTVSYLMRVIVRRYGMDALHQIAAIDQLTWVIPDYAKPNEDDARPDLFVTCGRLYQETREILAQCLLDRNLEPLVEKTREGLHDPAASSAFILSIFKEITSCYFSPDPRKHPTEQVIAEMTQLIQRIPYFENKELARVTLTNSMAQGCPQLRVVPTNNKNKVVTDIVTHFGVTMSTLPPRGLISLLRDIVGNPGAVRGMFLPTMPEDMRVELFNIVLARDGRATLFECPNGHPYIIGDCGGAVTDRMCPTCGLRIGGRGYQLAQDNARIDNMQDTTKTGHALGNPANRSDVPDAQHDLSPTSTALLRLLVHLALFAGANTQPNAVHALITPTIEEAAVPDFLWQHIICDLKVIERATSKSADDSALLAHLLINQLSKNFDQPQVGTRLLSKPERRAWENAFTATYITPLLSDLDAKLQEANGMIANDTRLGNNPLLKVIHETDGMAGDVPDMAHIEQIPAMWRYRARVTLEHLRKELTEKITQLRQQQEQQADQNQNKLMVLDLFLKKEQVLRVVQLLPNIVHLVHLASQYYHRKIARDEANQITIRDFLTKIRPENKRREAQEWFVDFATAWTVVHPQLTTHVISEKVLPERYCDMVMNEDAPISTLLPSLRGYGFCSTALLHYLTTIHNNFMEDFCRLSRSHAGPTIGLMDVNSTHVITYHQERDLLQLVSAHCNYSLEVGRGTRIEYNFSSLEQQLKEKFICGKAILDCQLAPVVFCEDVNNATQFEILKKKIPQVPLTPAVQAQIRGDVRYMAEITECLASLNITIGFLVTIGGEPETMLQTFMTDTLQMDPAILTPKARQLCRLHHTRALWLLLSFEREKLVARYKQEPFTSVDVAEYREELEEEQKEELEAALQHMTCDVLLAELYECIILHLTVKQSRDDEDFTDNTKQELRMVMYNYLEGKDGPELPALTNGTFPQSILAEQCVETWRMVYDYILRNDQRY